MPCHLIRPCLSPVSTLVFFILLTALPYSAAFAVEFSLFGDVNIHNSDNEDESSSFSIGQIDLIANQEISPKSSVVVELVLEHEGNENNAKVDVEQFAIVREISEETQIGMGRFHTPLGIWNTSYHHGSLIQDTVSRPFFLDFEDSGGVLPVHFVGLGINGDISAFNYQFMMGNSSGLNTEHDPLQPTSRELIVFNQDDLSNKKAYVLRTGLGHLDHSAEIGLNYMSTHVLETGLARADPNFAPLTAQGETLFDQIIIGLDLHWEVGNFYILSEIYQIKTSDNPQLFRNDVNISNPEEYTADAAYVQLSYTIQESVTLSVRYESLKFEAGNTYMNELGVEPEQRNVAVVSYHIEESNSLRFEINQSNIDNLAQDTYLRYVLQWYFLLI